MEQCTFFLDMHSPVGIKIDLAKGTYIGVQWGNPAWNAEDYLLHSVRFTFTKLETENRRDTTKSWLTLTKVFFLGFFRICVLQSTVVPNWESTKPHLCSNSHFSRHPNECWECRYNLALLNHLYHIWELSNEVLYDPVPKRVSKIQKIKNESSSFIR